MYQGCNRGIFSGFAGPQLPEHILGAIIMGLENKAPITSRASRNRPARSRVFQAAALAVSLIAIGSTGCNVFSNVSSGFRYSDTFNSVASKLRHRSMSSKSWHRHKNRFCNEPCMSDFCAGYRQGFEDVALGSSNGCTPNFPPRDYWGWQYQSAEGQKKVSSWFSGYPHGARAAEEEGVGNWAQIQMSSNLQAQYVTSGLLPNQGHAVYPITEVKDTPRGGPSPAMMPLSSNAGGQAANRSASLPGEASSRPVPMSASGPSQAFGQNR